MSIVHADELPFHRSDNSLTVLQLGIWTGRQVSHRDSGRPKMDRVECWFDLRQWP